MKKVLITGAAGIIGTVLRRHLTEYDITPVDIVPLDDPAYRRIDVASEYEKLLEATQGQDAVVHLAWDMRENFHTDVAVPENKLMAENIYRAAMETRPHPRVIIASSVHAAGGYIKWNEEPYRSIARKDFVKAERPRLITTNMEPFPDSIYGASKVYIEFLGVHYASELPATATKDFAEWLRIELKTTGLNLNRLAGATEFSYATVWRILNRREPYNKSVPKKFVDKIGQAVGKHRQALVAAGYGYDPRYVQNYISHGYELLQIIALRLGGVNPEDRADIDEENWCYHATWLSQRDCGEIFRRCIDANLSQFSLLFATSNNRYGVFDISETVKSLGYMPRDDSLRFL